MNDVNPHDMDGWTPAQRAQYADAYDAAMKTPVDTQALQKTSVEAYPLPGIVALFRTSADESSWGAPRAFIPGQAAMILIEPGYDPENPDRILTFNVDVTNLNMNEVSSVLSMIADTLAEAHASGVVPVPTNPDGVDLEGQAIAAGDLTL